MVIGTLFQVVGNLGMYNQSCPSTVHSTGEQHKYTWAKLITISVGESVAEMRWGMMRWVDLLQGWIIRTQCI
jgi:hypothetical protein